MAAIELNLACATVDVLGSFVNVNWDQPDLAASGVSVDELTHVIEGLATASTQFPTAVWAFAGFRELADGRFAVMTMQAYEGEPAPSSLSAWTLSRQGDAWLIDDRDYFFADALDPTLAIGW